MRVLEYRKVWVIGDSKTFWKHSRTSEFEFRTARLLVPILVPIKVLAKTSGCVSPQNQSYSGMSLSKIPFILLVTWGISTSYTPPNPQPPKQERFSSVPLENSGYVQWAPILIRVSNYIYRYSAEKNH